MVVFSVSVSVFFVKLLLVEILVERVLLLSVEELKGLVAVLVACDLLKENVETGVMLVDGIRETGLTVVVIDVVELNGKSVDVVVFSVSVSVFLVKLLLVEILVERVLLLSVEELKGLVAVLVACDLLKENVETGVMLVDGI